MIAYVFRLTIFGMGAKPVSHFKYLIKGMRVNDLKILIKNTIKYFLLLSISRTYVVISKCE